MVPKPEIFSNNFRAVTIDSKGNEKSFDFDQHEFYHGYLKGTFHNKVNFLSYFVWLLFLHNFQKYSIQTLPKDFIQWRRLSNISV